MKIRIKKTGKRPHTRVIQRKKLNSKISKSI